MDIGNKYGTLKIQRSLLELLKEFDSFCCRNGIKYSLEGGTLLGAIRHKGFIPWDDDLDILVDRDNYFKLLAVIGNDDKLSIERMTEETLWVDRVRLLESSETPHEESYKPTIDIFILDNVPNNSFEALIKKYAIYILQGMSKSQLNLNKGSIIMKFCSLVTYLMGLPFSHQTKYRWYNKISQWRNADKCDYVSCYNGLFSMVGILFHNSTLDVIVLHEFEDMKAPITSDYDFYLKQVYGDYMTPPKEKDRHPMHIKNE